MPRRIGSTLGALLALLVFGGTSARAGTAGQCGATKERLAGKKIAALTRCDARAVAKGVAADPDCMAKARASFSARWAKVEAKGGCVTSGDEATIEGKVDAFVGDLETRLQADGPPSRCSAGKFKDAGRSAACELGCTARAAAHGLAADDSSVATCRASCAGRLQARFGRDETKGDCRTTGDAASIETVIAALVDDVDGELAPAVPTTAPTTTTTVTTTTLPTFPGGIFESPNSLKTRIDTHPKL